MEKKVKNRKRNRIINFRVSQEERDQIEAKILVSGMQKSDYFIQSTLGQPIHILAGKYQSDRLSVEIKRIRERLEDMDLSDAEIRNEVHQCRLLIAELTNLMEQIKNAPAGNKDI